MVSGIFKSSFETYTKYSVVDGEEQKRLEVFFCLFKGSFDKSCRKGPSFIYSSKGLVKNSLGNPDLYEQ